MKHLKKIIALLILVPLAVLAITIENPLKYGTVQDLINAIINFIFTLALWTAPIMFLLSGFYFITAAGQPEKIKTAQSVALYTFIGLLIVIAAKGLVNFFMEYFTKVPVS